MLAVAGLAMVTLVMDGQRQDEFLHCMDSGLEQERINVTFRRIRQNVASCPLLRTGVALFSNECAGFVDCCCKVCGQRCLLGILGAPSPAGFFLFMSAGSLRCACRWTADVGGGIIFAALWELTCENGSFALVVDCVGSGRGARCTVSSWRMSCCPGGPSCCGELKMRRCGKDQQGDDMAEQMTDNFHAHNDDAAIVSF